MAKETKPVPEAGSKAVIRLPADNNVRKFNNAVTDAIEQMDEVRDRLKDDTEVAKKDHLHIKAFHDVKKLFDKCKSAKNEAVAARNLEVYLSHFDHYRKYYKLDELAGLQANMIPDQPQDPEEPGRAVDEDGQEDTRPRHLRQPGASATDHVRDLASKAGASQRPDQDNLDQVGRGNKPH